MKEQSSYWGKMSIWNLSVFLKNKYLRICPYGKKQLDFLVNRCLKDIIVMLVLAVGLVIVWNGLVR